MDEKTGDLLWKRDIVDDVLIQLSPSYTSLVVDHKVIASSTEWGTGPPGDIEICLFDESNGDKIWSVELDFEEIAIYFAVANGKLFVKTLRGIYVYS